MNASSKKKLAQYEHLAGMLRDRIAAGIYARGDKLPSEMELMDESGLSRSTVRHALKVLVDEGLVRTERGTWCLCGRHAGASTRTTWCFRAIRHRSRVRA